MLPTLLVLLAILPCCFSRHRLVRPSAPMRRLSLPVATSNASDSSLTFFETMAAGAVSRTVAQTVMHPANTYKTVLQMRGRDPTAKFTLERLLRGADAQFVMSLPHGAFYFWVTELVKARVESLVPSRLQFLADFFSSTISTVVCSIVSTPQMVLTDRLMAGVYPSFPSAVRCIIAKDGFRGFYAGWWPALAQKIPSYGLTWMFFQQLKRYYEHMTGEKPSSRISFGLGAAASAAAVSVMIPMDTIKTRLVIQDCSAMNPYKGVVDCFQRILREEGVGPLYRSLTPRLLSVVPMIAIQYGIYEFMKGRFLQGRSKASPVLIRRIRSRTRKVANHESQRDMPSSKRLPSSNGIPYFRPAAKVVKKQIPKPTLVLATMRGEARCCSISQSTLLEESSLSQSSFSSMR